MKRIGNILQGIYLVALGFFLIGENMGMFNIIHDMLYTWQALVIAIGIFQFLGLDIFGGLLTIVVGSVFYLPLFGYHGIEPWKIILPSVVVLIGLKIIFKGTCTSSNCRRFKY